MMFDVPKFKNGIPAIPRFSGYPEIIKEPSLFLYYLVEDTIYMVSEGEEIFKCEFDEWNNARFPHWQICPTKRAADLLYGLAKLAHLAQSANR